MRRSISDKAKIFSDEAYKYLVVNKLIDTIKKLENSPQSETRWIWELFQNGKDCVKANSKIKLKITLSNDSLAFEHNGRPFKIKDLVYLIDQTSSKSRKSKHLTGNYGTGFITTHLLSKIVHISGVLKSDKDDYRRFELELIRNSEDQKIMIENLDIALGTFEILEKTSPIEDFNKEDYNTKFKYKLDQKGLDIALKGLEDLNESVFLVLLFNKNIQYVSVNNKIKNEKIYYKIKEQTDNLYILNIKITDKNTNSKQSLNSEFLLYGINDLENEKENEDEIKNNVEIAFNVTNHYIVEKNKNAPVLFIDFPLIGSEEFPFPCYINSHNFKLTNDDRSHIILSGENNDTLNNIKLLKKAAELLMNFIDKATRKGDFENKHLLAKSFLPNNVNVNLYKKEIQYCIRDKLGNSKIIKNIQNKYIKPIDCMIPEILDILPQNENQKNKLIIKLHNIIAFIFRKSLICEDINYINYWIKTMDDDWINEFKIKNRFNLEDLIFFIESKKNLQELMIDLDFKDNFEVINWLNLVYEFIYESTNHKKAQEYLNDHSLIPNQRNELKKGSELYEDNDIPEIIKDLFVDFDIDIRKDVKNINIIHALEEDYKISEVKEVIISYFQDKRFNINKLIQWSFNIISIINELNENEKILKLMFLNMMNIFFKRKNASILIKESNEIIDSLSIIAENFLIESVIIPQIEELKNLNEFQNFFGLNFSQEDIIIWFNNFYLILENKVKIKILQEKSIFPNQIGEFKKGKELIKDNIYFEDNNEENELVIFKLKKFYVKIEKRNLFAELLDNRIQFENFFVISKEIKLKEISEKIEEYFKNQRNLISTNLVLKKKIKKFDLLLQKLTKNQRQMHFYWFENNNCSLLVDTIDLNSKEIILKLIRNDGQNLRLLLEQQNEN